MSIKKMHAEAKLLSLEQRRKFQLLSLMFRHKNTLNVRRVGVRNTRAAARFKFNVERNNNVKYKNSPYYTGSELWDKLLLATISCESMFEFKKCLKAEYKHYIV